MKSRPTFPKSDGSTINREAHSIESTAQMYERYELEQMEARDRVSDDALIARMLAAPDMGGSMLVELSEFVRNREKK